MAFHMPNRAECPGADFYTPLSRTEGTMMDQGWTNTRPMFDSEMKTTDFQSDTPTWMTDSMSTKTMNGGSSSQNTDWPNPSPQWTPGRGRSTNEGTVTSQTMSEMGSSRSSYGRGMSWLSTTTSTITPPSNTWRVSGAYPPTPTPWYPSRSKEEMMMDNAVDEPNQQGLESNSTLVSFSKTLISLSLILLMLLTR